MPRKFLVPAEVKLAGDGAGSISGYASTFGNVDSERDTVVPGAYADTIPQFLKSGFVAASHDWAEPIAMPTVAREDAHGLYVEAEFHADPVAQRYRGIVSDRLARNLDVGLSIGYKARDFDYVDGGVRRLKAIDLYEWSIVAAPADAHALASGVKARKQSYLAVELEGSYEDLAEDIAEAWGGMATTVATYPGYAVVSVPDPNSYEPVYWRVAYTLDASGDPVLGERTQVEAQAVFAPADEPALSFASAMKRLGARARGLAAVRLKEGRAISERRRQQIADMADSLQGHADALRAMHTETAPPQKDVAAATELARFLAFEARRNGVTA